MHVFLLGYPGDMGGANSECWHTVRMWREAGWAVTLIPTWTACPKYRPRLDALGVKTVEVRRVSRDPDEDPSLDDRTTLADVPGLAGSPVVGMCNRQVISALDELRKIECRLVWMNCMTFFFEHEHRAWYDLGPPEVCVFQSHFQKAQLMKKLGFFRFDPDRAFVIRGAFDIDGWDHAPRPFDATEFMVGKLARNDAAKWPADLWPLLASVPVATRRALCMGWDEVLERKCGIPPVWAECLEPQAILPEAFLARCHALLAVNGGARENWPRVGLEAMAAGVPVVAPNKWGWREMIVDNESGCLGDSHADIVFSLAKLAREPHYREDIIAGAYQHLETIANPQLIVAQWQEALETAASAPVQGPTVRI